MARRSTNDRGLQPAPVPASAERRDGDSFTRVVEKLQRNPVIRLIQLLGSISILFAVIAYLAGSGVRAKQREEAKQLHRYELWKVLAAAGDRPVDGGRVRAIAELARDSVDLKGIDLEGTYLRGLEAPRAKLNDVRADSAEIRNADLRLADVSDGRFVGARMWLSDLRGAEGRSANFDGANIRRSCFGGSALSFSRFQRATIIENDFTFAELSVVDFRGALLSSVRFDSAALGFADFRNARLYDVSFEGADLRYARFWGATGDLDTTAIVRAGGSFARDRPQPDSTSPGALGERLAAGRIRTRNAAGRPRSPSQFCLGTKAPDAGTGSPPRP